MERRKEEVDDADDDKEDDKEDDDEEDDASTGTGRWVRSIKYHYRLLLLLLPLPRMMVTPPCRKVMRTMRMMRMMVMKCH